MKTHRALLVLAIALPLGVAEAQTPTPLPANPMATAFRTRTTTLRNNIARALDSIPADKYSFKPTPAQMSVGLVAAHVASDNHFFCGNFSDRKPTLSEKDATTHDSVKATWPKDTLVAKLKAANAFCDEVMATLDDAKVMEIWIAPGPNNTTRQALRGSSMLGHAIDTADHYSQLANYMRILGILPPTALPRRP